MTWLTSGLGAATFGVDIALYIESRKGPPQTPYGAEERAIVGAFWQLVSVRIAFAAIREVLARVYLTGEDIEIRVRPTRHHQRVFDEHEVLDDSERHEAYYADYQQHLKWLAAEMARVPRKPDGHGASDRAKKQLEQIKTARTWLEDPDLTLAAAIKLVEGPLDSVHNYVAKEMRRHFKTDLIRLRAGGPRL